MPTGIEWTDETWNPIRGCSRISPGCVHCYAEKMAMRFAGPGQAYEGLVQIGASGKARGWSGAIREVPNHLMDPYRWKRPRRIFVNSMSDLFHDNVPSSTLHRILAVVALSPQHQLQALTKRAHNMRDRLSDPFTRDGAAAALAAMLRSGSIKPAEEKAAQARLDAWPLSNFWPGVSVENQEAADDRIPPLLQTPAAVRFLSCEPLLGPVDLTRRPVQTPGEEACAECGSEQAVQDWLNPHVYCAGERECHAGGEALANPPIDWVIAGGESGRGARPMHPDWARSLRDQCADAGVPFFFKQWGEWAPWDRSQPSGGSDGFVRPDPEKPFASNGAYSLSPEHYEELGYAWMAQIGKRAAGDLLDGVQHHAFPL